MSLLDRISDLAHKFAPAKSTKPTSGLAGGIGNGHGMVAPEDDMIVSKPTIVLHASQIFFNFLAMACFAGVASFQAKWKVGPSGLTGFAIFVAIAGMFLSAFMLFVPVAYEKYDKFIRLARALKEVRVGFILTGTGVTFSLLIAFIVTISAWTQPGCKDPTKDPHAEANGDDFQNGLKGWCSTKKAGAIFFWLAFAFWAASLVMLILDWRSGKLHAPRDQPFQRPQMATHDEEEGDDEELDGPYTHVPSHQNQDSISGSAGQYNDNAAQSPFADPQRYGGSGAGGMGGGGLATPTAYTPALQQSIGVGRPSMDAYGAFSDPAPSGFGAAYGGAPAASSMGYSNAGGSSYTGGAAGGAGGSYTTSSYSASGAGASPAGRTGVGAPMLPEVDMGGPMVSRTMQYADPYAAVRKSIAGGPASPTSQPPPGYDGYSGYR